MELTQAVNIWWMDINKYIRENFLKEISSPMMNEPSTGTFHPQGLYSEAIFGQVGSKERIGMLGYIDLHCKILAPVAYLNLIAVASWYQDLMESKVYAIWDPTIKDYVPCKKEDPNARTGFYFFLEHVEELNLRKNDSKSRNNKIESLYKARKDKCTLISKWIVSPAGWRDVKIDNAGNMKVDVVNKLYTSLIVTSKELRTNVSPEMEKFFDVVKYHIQLKVVEIFQYWKMFWEGKTGFGQANYSKRNLTLGTRNVITAASLLAESPDDPRYIKHNETHMPLYQLAKGAAPIVVHALNTLFTAPVFTMGSVSVPAIDPDTLAIEYIEVTPHEVTYALDSKSKYEFINNFLDKSIRHDPVSIKDINNKIYWLWMVYDLDTSIYMFRNINDLEKLLEEQARSKNTLVKEYYHIATIDIGKTPTLEPRIPPVNSDLEDLILPRVSLSPTIDGCLIGTAHHFTTDKVAMEKFNSDGYQDTYVYKVKITDFDPVKFKSSEEIIENKLVFDAELTKECWSLTRVQGEFLGVIRVHDKVKTTYEFTPIRGGDEVDFTSPEGKLYAFLYEYEWIKKEVEFAKEALSENISHIVDRTKVRPLTKIEMLYIATFTATHEKYLTATRFPAVEVGSIYPSHIVSMSTDPSRVVTFKSQYSEQGDIQFPQYPVIGCDQYVDSAIIHPSKTKGLTADFDGDKMSFNIAMSKEATLEAKNHLASAASVISPSMKFYDTLDTMSVSFVLHSLTRLHSDDVVFSAIEE